MRYVYPGCWTWESRNGDLHRMDDRAHMLLAFLSVLDDLYWRMEPVGRQAEPWPTPTSTGGKETR